LFQYLDSQSPDVRMAAIGSLAKLKKPGTLERLLNVYEASNNANEKATVVRALAEFPSLNTSKLLKEALRSTIGRIRANAIDALVEIEGAKVLPLIEPLLEDENNRVRANAAMALYNFGQTRAYDYLDKMMGSDDKWMRLSAIWTLAEIGSVSSREIIVKHLNDSDYDVKLRAILSLNRLDRKLLTLLEEILTSREERVEGLDQESFGSPDKLNDRLARDY
ncbi:MAG: HEAT repeat domain-containing protein, partial [Verrucomicrobiota bacterium]|nr:HEAT repeat domain-containing protein [Verrucomicrobiota bacterium]